MTIKIVITDDHPVVADGLKNILESYNNIEVMQVYNTADALLANIKNDRPDVLVLDMQIHESDGYNTARAAFKMIPDLKILVFTNTDTVFIVKKMLKAGCLGYLLKNANEAMLVQAIETVARGSRFLSPEIEKGILDDLLGGVNSVPQNATLTKRESEILKLIANEHSSKEIADQLFLGAKTIEFYRSSLMQKLGVKNTAGLVRVAVEKGLL